MPMRAVVARAPTQSVDREARVVADDAGAGRGMSWLGATAKGADALARGARPRPDVRRARAPLVGGSRRGQDRQAQGQGRLRLLAEHAQGLRAHASEAADPGVRRAARQGDHRGRLAALGRPAQRGGAVSRSRIANQLSVVSAIYGWASRPTRQLVPRNPVRDVELPPNDEKPRTRVAPLEEAEQLLAALEPDDQVPYALAFYAGLRREEIHRLRWEDVELDGYRAARPQGQERCGHGSAAADRRAAARDPPPGRAA